MIDGNGEHKETGRDVTKLGTLFLLDTSLEAIGVLIFFDFY